MMFFTKGNFFKLQIKQWWDNLCVEKTKWQSITNEYAVGIQILETHMPVESEY